MMNEKVDTVIICRELLYLIPGCIYLLYILFPFRFWEPFVFSNQTETVVITAFFSCWKQAGWTVPSRFAPLYLTMKLHFKNGEYDAAKACAEQLLAKKIKIDNPEIDPMKRTARDILNFHPPP